ncbi:sensor histidine kinase [Streptomyces rapamycinicus]|uniref:histidine kinase n=2 Tax=Streptomyces rapamycinicus TaxID=1226757 RepID=A0A0A0NB49_STRRN|nr:histidine kinase [Streptomyces rapamycinicus]AGP56682.1 histidine kinase [Streptomyces rapamycinicus NRRL 5491]MBB4784289.1 signal transduction histidine kinase [Streptomyces rapamycinicus]RLV80227.1 histidine kinase [Streptomyces rapamycinicus NRRL 5491]UTO64612.1 two-component sensor histidine kinase [Streptomyces rapamycinicus]UTP32568.1 two-component sensor histidine kinase [Streptomyces rapamycinicus NRRL 5491]
MNTDVAPRLGWWQQAWRLGAAAAVGIPLWLSIGVVAQGQTGETGSWFLIGDPLVALGCLTALLWRRRFPLAVAMTVAIASTASALATGAACLGLVSLSTRRRPVESGVVGLALVTASQFTGGLYPVQRSPGSWWLELTLPALTAGIAVAMGMAIGARRVELRSLRDRAESAEREQTARAAQARALERNRIAREMHDVLAHRISLVAMQAGVLDHRGNLTAEENRVLVRGIADGSHQALEELRDVLGVLRADAARPEPPQPSLDRIPDLVADARTSGLDVTLTTTVAGTPSDAIGRTCYRIVQEGLTNAAKHAPGARVHITLEGTAGDNLDVSVHNSPSTRATAPPPTSGFGLLGLTERITLAGGELDHHPTPDNGYLLTARLPWPNPTHEKRA